MRCLSPWIEFRARRIADPLARLTYLRRCAGLTPRPRRFNFPVRGGVFLAFLLAMAFALPFGRSLYTPELISAGPLLPKPMLDAGTGVPAQVWLVEEKEKQEIYSNGLRVETGFTTSTERREMIAVHRETLQLVAERSNHPAGIVFHTTESNLAPFQEGHNGRLRRVGQWLLQYVRDKQCYHYVIDRFGRVHRVVRETDRAYHAGPSIWADRERIYLSLNNSFLGVSFESQTRPEDGGSVVTPAQVRAARSLVEMLRSRYAIQTVNCITHAQVSVNPRNMRIGNHIDWAAEFPYADLGLPDNYELPLPSMYEFGFGYDPSYLTATGARLWKGLVQSEELVRQQATARGLEVMHHRATLKERYRKLTAALPSPGEAKENRSDE